MIRKGIVSIRELLQQGSYVEVGNGHLTNVWNDVWLGDSSLIVQAQVVVPAYLCRLKVSKLIYAS